MAEEATVIRLDLECLQLELCEEADSSVICREEYQLSPLDYEVYTLSFVDKACSDLYARKKCRQCNIYNLTTRRKL